MLGITPFGMLHTLVSLVSLFAGIYALVRHRELSSRGALGAAYVGGTLASCVTGLFIFRHGGFNEAHALSITTLLVLAIAGFAERGARPGSMRRILSVLAYTLTLFFHFIPGFNETLVRVPVGNPVITGPDDPLLMPLVGATFAVFAVVMLLQVLRIRRERAQAPLASPAALR